MEWLTWFTQMENAKSLATLMFFIAFCLILFYVYGNRSRGERLESYKNMPFADDDTKGQKS